MIEANELLDVKEESEHATAGTNAKEDQSDNHRGKRYSSPRGNHTSKVDHPSFVGKDRSAYRVRSDKINDGPIKREDQEDAYARGAVPLPPRVAEKPGRNASGHHRFSERPMHPSSRRDSDETSEKRGIRLPPRSDKSTETKTQKKRPSRPLPTGVNRVRPYSRYAKTPRVHVELYDPVLPVTSSDIPRGKFVTFEGGEGVGKSTQARLLRSTLRAMGIPCAMTREPGGTPFGERIRALLLETQLSRQSEMLLLLASRWHHVQTVIEPSLARGEWVICDRFIDSSVVYQALARQEDPAWIHALHSAVGLTLKPDLTIMLESPLKGSLGRRRNNPASCNKFDYANEAFHIAVKAGFESIALQHPDRCARIVANRPMGLVRKEIFKQVSHHFSLVLEHNTPGKNLDRVQPTVFQASVEDRQ